MSDPFPDLCVQIELASTMLSFKHSMEFRGEAIEIDAAGRNVANINVWDVIPDLARFSSFSTRGWCWQDQLLSYLAVIDGEMYLVGHPWWQSRFAISLRQLRAVPTGPLMSKLVEIERKLVVEGLDEFLKAPLCRRFRATREGRAVFERNSLFRLAGDLKMHSLVPILREIESWPIDVEPYFNNYGIRRVVQIALRKLGHSPRFPLSHDIEPSCFECDPECYARNRQKVLDALPGMDAKEISNLFGPPDAVSYERSGELTKIRWQFDIEMNEPISVILYLPTDGTRIEKIKHYRPALWSGPQYFSSEGRCNYVCNEVSLGELDSSFLGSCTEIFSSNERPCPSPST